MSKTNREAANFNRALARYDVVASGWRNGTLSANDVRREAAMFLGLPGVSGQLRNRWLALRDRAD